MAVKLFLNSQTILNHEFPLTHKNAYDAEEVDKFLDMVLQDYKVVESNVIISTSEYESLRGLYEDIIKMNKSDKRKIEVELEKYKARFTNIKSSDNVTTDNIELVRKINALEKFLWSHGFNPDTIK